MTRTKEQIINNRPVINTVYATQLAAATAIRDLIIDTDEDRVTTNDDLILELAVKLYNVILEEFGS